MNTLTTPEPMIARPANRADRTTNLVNQENAMTLIHEALARSHREQGIRVAAEYRLARRLTAGRGWTRLASWASARADRARARVR